MYSVNSIRKLNAQSAADEAERFKTAYTVLQDGGLLIRHNGIARIHPPEDAPGLLACIRAAKTPRGINKTLADVWHGRI